MGINDRNNIPRIRSHAIAVGPGANFIAVSVKEVCFWVFVPMSNELKNRFVTANEGGTCDASPDMPLEYYNASSNGERQIFMLFSEKKE